MQLNITILQLKDSALGARVLAFPPATTIAALTPCRSCRWSSIDTPNLAPGEGAVLKVCHPGGCHHVRAVLSLRAQWSSCKSSWVLKCWTRTLYVHFKRCDFQLEGHCHCFYTCIEFQEQGRGLQCQRKNQSTLIHTEHRWSSFKWHRVDIALIKF